MMDPQFAQDWEKSKARYEAWWNNDVLDRPPVFITCPRETPRWEVKKIPVRREVEPERLYLDAQYKIDTIENTLATTEYLGDGYPHFMRGINTAYLGMFAGATPEFTSSGTVWIAPFIDDWKTAPAPKFDVTLPLFQRLEQVATAMEDNARGRYLIDQVDPIDCITTMSQMRGVDKLCLDLYDNPEPVTAYRDSLTSVWLESHRYWIERDVKKGLFALSNWTACMEPTMRGGVIQCDFLTMISPDMFEWFVRPELTTESNLLKNALYHLDGPEQIPHLDALCSIENLNAVQWIQGAGKPPSSEWGDLFKRIQGHGRALQVRSYVNELDKLFEILDPKGVQFVMNISDMPSKNVESCNRVVEKIGKWAAGKKSA